MSDWPKPVRILARERSEGVCERCGCARATHLHHRERRGKGNHTIENAFDTCERCHDYIHAHVTESRREGWIVIAPDRPGEHGIRYRGAWVKLDSNGFLVF